MHDRKPKMRKFWFVGLLALLSLLVLDLAMAQEYWFESYRKSVEMIDAGNLDAASEKLEAVIAEHPAPHPGLRIPGNQILIFLPYFQRARIEFQQGEHEKAIRSMDISAAFGAIRASKTSLKEMTRMRNQVLALLDGKAAQDKRIVLATAQ